MKPSKDSGSSDESSSGDNGPLSPLPIRPFPSLLINRLTQIRISVPAKKHFYCRAAKYDPSEALPKSDRNEFILQLPIRTFFFSRGT